MVQSEDTVVHNRNIDAPRSLITNATIIGHGINSSSFSSDVELDSIGFGSFFCSGSEDVFGRLLPNCAVVESNCGIDD